MSDDSAALPQARCAACDRVYSAAAAPVLCPFCDVVVPPHPHTSPFARLGLVPGPDITDAAVDAAWLARSRQVHPDRYGQKSPAERRAAAEQTVAMNDAMRQLKTQFDRAAWFVSAAGAAEPPLPQARLIAFMALREEAEESADGKARVVASAVADFARFSAVLSQQLHEVNWEAPTMTPAPLLRKIALTLSELRTLARLSADLGGPVLVPSFDRRG
jgi:molecular chaperone HscB